MTKKARPYAEMRAVAACIVQLLSAHCERIEVAGSVRRQRPQPSDIEIVAIPRYVPAGLFGDQQANDLHAYLAGDDDWVFLKGDNPDGRYYQLALRSEDDLQVDLFLASPDNWGLIHLIRTGSAEFSGSVLAAWKRRQGIDTDHQGSMDGRLVDHHGAVVPTPEEADVFRLVGYPQVPPELRNAPIGQLARPLPRQAVQP